MKRLVVTGSHPSPAAAFLEALPSDIQVFNLGKIDSPKFKRYDWRSLLGLIRLPAEVTVFRRQLRQIKPRLVISFGGYQAVPVCWAAWWEKIPLIIHEQTFGAGLASRIISPFAQKIAISWPSSRQYFPKPKTILVGNPLRRQILTVKRQPEAVLYICGGHQGSQVLNQAVTPLLNRLCRRFLVYHQCGPLYQPQQRRNYVVKSYFSVTEVATIYRRARLVVSRSGINTVTELGYLGIPAVLVPLPYTQRKEQETNAEYLNQLGLATVLPQSRLQPDSLLAAINHQEKRALQLILPTDFPRERIRGAADSLAKLCLSYFSS